MSDRSGARRQAWIRLAAVCTVAGIVIVAGWLGAPHLTSASFDDATDAIARHRTAWYALPATVLAFVLLGLAMVPVLLLITVTGIAFGPWLGPLYAMAGCLASASIGFAIGRWTGLGHIERLGSTRVTRVVRSLERNGTLAVFLLRKIPVPFLLANIVAGASRVRYRDFLAGTFLGMGAVVVALAGFGHQLTNVLQQPSFGTVLIALVAVGIPLSLAWLVNRRLRPA